MKPELPHPPHFQDLIALQTGRPSSNILFRALLSIGVPKGCFEPGSSSRGLPDVGSGGGRGPEYLKNVTRLKTRRKVSAVSIAVSEYLFCPPRFRESRGFHASIASCEIHIVMSPRWTSARS